MVCKCKFSGQNVRKLIEKSWKNQISCYFLCNFAVCIGYVIYIDLGNSKLSFHVPAKYFEPKKAPEVKQKSEFLPSVARSL